MAEGNAYYITAVDDGWQIKREGGASVIKKFARREEALAYAQLMIAKQAARFRLQDRHGVWQGL